MRNLMSLKNYAFLGGCRGFYQTADGGWWGGKYGERFGERRSAASDGSVLTSLQEIFLNAEDLESARHQTYKTRQRMTHECIKQQSLCLDARKYFERKAVIPDWETRLEMKGCPELLSTSCVIEPVGILNAAGYNCGDPWDDGPDCSEKIIPTAMCSESYNAMNPGCKGFVDREVFEESCHRGRMGSNWKEIWKADIEKLGLEAMTSHVSARIRACSAYVAGMPDMTNQFE